MTCRQPGTETTCSPEISLRVTCEVDIDAIVRLYKEAQWWEDHFTPEFIPPMVRNSTCFVVAENPEGEIIGMGRAISDNSSDAYIQDVTVLPCYRGKGIGSRIISTIIDELQKRGIDWIGLIGEPGTKSFYTRLGFKPMQGYIPMRLESPQ